MNNLKKYSLFTASLLAMCPNPKKYFGAIKASAGKRAAVRTKAKIGRNESCPYGSGKKYKKCCLKQ